MVLGEPFDFEDGEFSATIIAGVFTQDHAPHSSFDELIQVTMKGDHLVFNVREEVYEEKGFQAAPGCPGGGRPLAVA